MSPREPACRCRHGRIFHREGVGACELCRCRGFDPRQPRAPAHVGGPGLFGQPPAPPIVHADPRLEPVELPRLTDQAREILALLRSRSRVSNGELATVALRYSARILELRRAGFRIDLVERDRSSGRTVYALLDGPGVEPPGACLCGHAFDSHPRAGACSSPSCACENFVETPP